jgi:integrase
MKEKRPPQPKAEPGIKWKWREDIQKWFPYVRVYADGKQRCYTPRQPTLTAARMLRNKIKAEADEARLHPERYQKRAKQATVQTFIDRYMPTVAAKGMAKEEPGFAEWWGRFCGERPVTALDAEQLEAARIALRKGLWPRSYKPGGGRKEGYGRVRSFARINRYTQWLHQVFGHAVNQKYLPNGKNPVGQIKKYDEVEPPAITATPDQERQLCEILEKSTPGSTDWLALAMISVLRQGEQFNRLQSDIVTDGPIWFVVIPKPKRKKKARLVAIPDSARPIMERLLATPGPWLIHRQAPYDLDLGKPFPVRQWYKTKFRAAVKAVGLPMRSKETRDGFTWHSLRHIFASRMLKSGATGKIAQKAGGWSSEAMLERYGKFEDLLPMAEAMERAALKFSRLGTGLGTGVGTDTAPAPNAAAAHATPAIAAPAADSGKTDPAQPFSTRNSLGTGDHALPPANTQLIDK